MEIQINSRKYGAHTLIIDDSDYEAVSKHKWWVQYQADKRRLHAVCTKVKRKYLALHTYLTGYKITDHVNGNVLDNRRENLRNCTIAENSRNRKISLINKSGYKGVIRFRGKWRATITVNNICIFISDYDSKEDAAKAYNQAAIKYHGEFARLNIIEETV